ncbi:hypothetical protein LSAT2_010618, partial [Lamellibrachia satsuma]
LPTGLKHSGRQALNGTRPMTILLVGASSKLTYHLIKMLMQEGHRITVADNMGIDLNVAYEECTDITHMLADLKRSLNGGNLAIRSTVTCDLKSIPKMDIGNGTRSSFTHVVVIGPGSPWQTTDKRVMVEHNVKCMTSLLESMKAETPSPHLTVLLEDNEEDTTYVFPEYNGHPNIFKSVVTKVQEIIANLYNDLHGLRVTSIKMPANINYGKQDTSIYATIINTIIYSMLKEALCETVRVTMNGNTVPHGQIYIDRRRSNEAGRLSVDRSVHDDSRTGNMTVNESSAFDRTFVQDTRGGDFVFTTYFTSKKDPQRYRFTKANDLCYMSAWHDSLVKHGLQTVIFHDGLSHKFTNHTEPFVSFKKVLLGDHSTNDERFFHYLRYLESHPYIKRILLTDVSDVVFLRNPFDLMRLLGDRLYVGEDLLSSPTVSSNGWLKNKLTECYGRQFDTIGDTKSLSKFSVVYNAGVIGRPRNIVLRFLRKLTAVLNTSSPKKNCNMAAVNYIAHKYFDDIVFSGFPLTSPFKQFELVSPGVYLVHK